MKYEYLQSFLDAVRNKSFKGRVIVNSYSVLAYESGELVFDFDDRSPVDALFFVLEALGADVDNA